MNCNNLKIKLNRSFECKKLHKQININDCANCIYKEYKMHNKLKKIVQNKELRKLERDRFSLFTNDLSHCYLCHKPKDHLHEVIFGKNRQNSMKYGLVLPLCEKHHRLMHKDANLQLEYKRKGQVLFNKTYPNLVFENIFHKNYL